MPKRSAGRSEIADARLIDGELAPSPCSSSGFSPGSALLRLPTSDRADLGGEREQIAFVSGSLAS
jgi:hypothetical protein